MFECLILGDSIGVGTASAINARLLLKCDVLAVEFATADQVRKWRKPPKTYGTTIIAVGSNNPPGRALKWTLLAIRRSLRTQRAIWLLPYARPAAYTVSSVAVVFHDETLDLGRFPTKDGVHPASYEAVAKVLLK